MPLSYAARAVPGRYLPVIEGALLLLPGDSTEQLVRRNNAAARVRPDAVFMTGLPDESHDALMERFAAPLKARARRISTAEDIERLANPARFKGPPMLWGNDRIGIGLLKALRAHRSIIFTDVPSPEDWACLEPIVTPAARSPPVGAMVAIRSRPGQA